MQKFTELRLRRYFDAREDPSMQKNAKLGLRSWMYSNKYRLTKREFNYLDGLTK